MFVFYSQVQGYAFKTTPIAQLGVASRNLMSRSDTIIAPTLPVPSCPTITSLRNLLQKSTSRLLCEPRPSNKTHHNKNTWMHSCSDKRTGYILVVSFHEQQTKASDNLFGLQCWGKALLVNIVEPFIENSHFVVPLRDNLNTELLRFGDLFDLDVWQLLTAQYKFAPLASWNDFLIKAPRQLIVVHFKYLTSKNRKSSNNESVTHLALNSNYKGGCVINTELSKKIHYLTSEHDFRIVREVCFNFAMGDELTQFQFHRHLYGALSPGAVTVLMEEWRGLGTIENGKRVVLFDACLLAMHVQSMAYSWPSQQLICDAKKYRQKYLKTANYISLMVRTEKILSLDNSREFMSNCLNETLKAWRELKASTGTKTTFLSMDIGNYGSDSLEQRKFYWICTRCLYGRYLGPLPVSRAGS